MAALLHGLHTSLYMMNRLKVYFEYYTGLPASTATANLRVALLEFCGAILTFLAEAVLTFRKNTALRTVQALWRNETCPDFEEECDRIAQRAEAEAHNCDRQLSVQDRRKAKDLGDRLEASLEDLQRLHLLRSTVADLQDKFDLSGLHAVNEAAFDSHDEEHNARCLAGTRVGTLEQVERWVDEYDSEQIFWLHGGAGTGKSTISRTVAHNLHKQDQLGASFFFKRGEGDRSKARRLFTTIAEQLAQKSPSIRRGVIETLNKIPNIAHKALSEQFDDLILKPLSENNYNVGVNLIAVIDALDEIDSDLDIQTVLSLFRRLGQVSSNMRLRLFMTSRPEVPVRLGFSKMTKKTHRDITLHEVAPPVIEHDIALYMKHEFASIRDSRMTPSLALPEDWPGQEAIRALVQRAVPLFIFAATTCRFIGDPKGNPKSRLKKILDQQNQTLGSKLDQTYQPVLEQLLADQSQGSGEGDFEQYMELIGSIVLLADPLSAKSVSTLLRVDYEDVCTRLEWLHSVLSVPEDPNAPVRPLHLSFREYLIDPRKRNKSQFWVDERRMHDMLATRCIELLSESGRLKQDICNLEMPGARRADISNHTIQDAIPAEVAYACRYWVYHIQRSHRRLKDGGQVDTFLRAHLLHWIEALSWLNSLSNVIGFLSSLRSLTDVGLICYSNVQRYNELKSVYRLSVTQRR